MSQTMERKVGDIFDDGSGARIKVVDSKDDDCIGCHYNFGPLKCGSDSIEHITGSCSSRKDDKQIIFVRVEE